MSTSTDPPDSPEAPGRPDKKVVDPTPHARGKTTPSMSEGLAPRLPHERDESADSQPSPPRPVIEQARHDVQGGLVDTDRGPVAEALYQRTLRGRNSSKRAGETPKRVPRSKPSG